MYCYRPLAVLLALPVPALGQGTQPSEVLDTGVVQFEFFDNGELGADTGVGTGFVFNGWWNTLAEGTFLVGQSFTQVSGATYEGQIGAYEWVNTSALTAVTPPAGFDIAFQTVYDDSGATGDGPIGLEVTSTAFARTGDLFVFVQFDIENTSGGGLTGLYPGIFADWDVSSLAIVAPDVACRDADTQLLYAWSYFEDNPNYYGQMAIDTPSMDVNVTGINYRLSPFPPGDSLLFGGLTTIQEPCPTTRIEVQSVLGVGPIDIDAGASETVLFAFVAGASEDEIIANARDAGCLFISKCPDPPATEPSSEAAGVLLHAPYPNPARGTTTLSFTLARPQPVRLAVLDALGREVAVLAEGVRGVGDHTVRWEAAGLPAGVYLVRLTAGDTAASRTVTLLR